MDWKVEIRGYPIEGLSDYIPELIDIESFATDRESEEEDDGAAL